MAGSMDDPSAELWQFEGFCEAAGGVFDLAAGENVQDGRAVAPADPAPAADISQIESFGNIPTKITHQSVVTVSFGKHRTIVDIK